MALSLPVCRCFSVGGNPRPFLIVYDLVRNRLMPMLMRKENPYIVQYQIPLALARGDINLKIGLQPRFLDWTKVQPLKFSTQAKVHGN